MSNTLKIGELSVYTGPMFAKKTTGLLMEVESELEKNNKVLVIKPKIDKRYGENDIQTHDGVSLVEDYKIIPVLKSTNWAPFEDDEDINILKNISLLAIDEAQFFESPLFVKGLHDLMLGTDISRPMNIVVAGLDMDSFGKPFGKMGELMAIAAYVYKRTAKCTKCGIDATHTWRSPIVASQDAVLIGGKETYEARCKLCWK